MDKFYKNSLFIFRRDLRITDNTALLAAAQLSENVIPCFIFDPRQISSENKLRSMNAIQFMMEALDDLDDQLRKRKGKLLLLHGNPHEIVKKVVQAEKIDAVFVNRDYTPFSIKRDELIKKECIALNVEFKSFADLLLHEPEEITSLNGTPYEIFTPFFKKAWQLPVLQPVHRERINWNNKISSASPSNVVNKLKSYNNPALQAHGTRAKALSILKSMGKFETYEKTHDIPSIDTTNLSVYIKFGLVSIREVYAAIAEQLGSAHPLIRQLFWRDFFTHVAYFSPFIFGQPFKQMYKTLPWDNSKRLFLAWCSGKTGFPIVDAGMRQLNQTGFIHNRARLIVASFLVKDLHIDWQWGERYFAQNLIDYDPAVNNGNWQWAASTGTDSQPYFRIFNPWLQQQKFDPRCIYVKKWVPELKNVPIRQIHTWFKLNNTGNIDYPLPLVDHTKEAEIAKKRYKEIKG